MTVFAAQTALLQPQTLTLVTKQVVANADAILDFMGFKPGGVNERYFGHGRTGDFNVYNDTRLVAKGRAPGTSAGRSGKQNMKSVPFTYPRMHDSISMSAEFFHNLGQIANPAQRDEAGRQMMAMQTTTLNQKAANWRVALTMGMLKDSLYFTQIGDDWQISYSSSGSLLNIPFQVPAGNKNQLSMTDRAGNAIPKVDPVSGAATTGNIIDVPWSSAGANIPLHIAQINQARNAQGVGPIQAIVLNSVMWNNVIKNDYLQSQAGISNPVFTTYEREVGKRSDGTPVFEYIGRFNALPGIDWHITDAGLELWNSVTSSFAFTRHLDNATVLLMSDPKARTDGYSLYQGSEPIAEYDGGPVTVKVGLASWSKATSNPTGWEVYVLENCLPVNHDPFAIDIATVAGF